MNSKPETELQTIAKMLSMIHFELERGNMMLRVIVSKIELDSVKRQRRKNKGKK